METIRAGEGAEITTSAPLLVTVFAGVLAAQGYTFTPTVLGGLLHLDRTIFHSILEVLIEGMV